MNISARFLETVLSVFGLGIDAQLNFDDAPGGDLSLDDVFGEPRTQTTVEEPRETPVDPAATTQQNEPLLKTKTGTVYKTTEDAIAGIEHKDTLIAQLREQLQRQTGRDPLTPPAQTQSQVPQSYLENQDQYFKDIASAVEKRDTRGYMEAQRKLVYDSLGPIAPTLLALSKAHAEQSVQSQLPEFKGFMGSTDYQEVMGEAPLLADAIRSAESNPAAAQQLPELYRLAYLSSRGRKLPQLIQSAESQRTAPAVPRPTVHSTPVPPPAAGTVVSPTLNTAEGRKALIQQMEGRGVGDLKF